MSLLFLFGSTLPAEAAGVWSVQEDISSRHTEGMSCAVEAYWDGGSSFSIFVNGHDFLGFMISDPAWSLDKGGSSRIAFHFDDGSAFRFPVEVVGESVVIGDLGNERGGLFLHQFQERWELRISFPRGPDWIASLDGSLEATAEWVACYRRLVEARGGETPRTNPF